MKNADPLPRALIVLLLLVLATLASGQDRRGLEVMAQDLGAERAAVGRQIAVLVAVDRYREWLPLKNPVKDARELRSILEERYWIDQFEELYDAEATKAGILRLFEKLVMTTKPEDSVFIYYAGHGQLDQVSETGFWIPVDAGTDRYEQKNWIPNNQVRNLIGKMKARHIALASDSCFSGDILNPSRSAAPEITQEYFRNAYARVSRQVLTSGASETVPDDSPFSRQLKLALEGNQKPYLDPLMLFSEVRLGVSGTTPLFGSLKDSGHQEGGSFLFFLKGGKAAAPAASRPASGQAELMVSVTGLGAEGAEIFVDGQLVGKAPILLQRLPAERKLVVEARTGSHSGKVELSLKDRELRELAIPLAPMKGNLFILANEKEVRLVLDGQDRGLLGAGLVRDLPAGEHRLELVGVDLYWSGAATVSGDETARIEARVEAVGRLSVEAPADARVTVLAGGKEVARVSGSKVFERLPAGSYELRASGPGYDEVTGRVSVVRGGLASWKPFATGSIEFSMEPREAAWAALGLGSGSGKAAGRLDGVAPGSYVLTISAAGYRDASRTVTVAVGQTSRLEAKLERFASGSVVVRGLPFGAEIGLGEGPRRKSLSGEELVFEGLPSGVELALRLDVACAEEPESGLPASLSLAEGERRVIEFPAGRFSLPWAPEDLALALAPTGRPSGSLELPLGRSGELLLSPPLLPGLYRVAATGPYPMNLQLRIEAGKDVELPGYRAALLSALGSARTAADSKLASSRKGRIAAGWVSFGTGALGAAGSVAAYLLGQAAYAAYDAAEASADAAAARSRIQLWGMLFPAAAGVGGLGLGLAPILWAGPKKSGLEDAVRRLDEAIGKLQEQQP